jgi:hypothetical protein
MNQGWTTTTDAEHKARQALQQNLTSKSTEAKGHDGFVGVHPTSEPQFLSFFKKQPSGT